MNVIHLPSVFIYYVKNDALIFKLKYRGFTATITVADLRGGARSKFFQFHAVFGEILAKSYVGAPPEGWRLHLREMLDPPLNYFCFVSYKENSCTISQII